EADDDEEPADADGNRLLPGGERDQDHQTKTNAHHRHPGTAVTAAGGMPDVVMAIQAAHGAIEASRVDLWSGNETSLDHRDPFPDLEFAHAGLGERRDDGVDEGAGDGGDRDEERAD